MKLHSCLAAAACLAAVGCGGGQTGDLSGQNDNGGRTTGSSGCDDHATPIALDDASLGFSAESVLAYAATTFDAPLTWVPPGDVQYSPESGQGSIRIAISSLDSSELVHSTPPDQSQSGILLGYVCPPDRLRIAVHVEVTTGGGALAEAFDGSLEASSSDFARLDHEFDLGALGGSLRIDHVDAPLALPDASEAQVTHFGLAAVLVPGTMAGALTATVEASSAAVAGVSRVTLARWPDDPACPTEEGGNPSVPVEAGQSMLGTSGTEAASSIETFNPLAFTWSSGATTDLSLSVGVSSKGCLRIDPYFDPSIPAAAVDYAVTLGAVTSDGKLDGSYPATLTTSRLPGGGNARALEVYLPLAVADVGNSGFAGVSAPTDAESLAVRMDAQFQNGTSAGTLSLEGVTPAVCDTTPLEPVDGGASAAPGCAGDTFTPIASGSWGDR